MDAVCLNLRRLGCAGQLDGLHDMFNAPRYAGGYIIANLLIDFLFQWGFILCDLSERVFAHRVEDCPFLVANVFLFLSSQQFFQFRNFNRVSLMCHGILLLCQGYVVYLHYQDIEKGHSTFGFCRW